jgi:uncharacterized membrane protein YedE/YeeE
MTRRDATFFIALVYACTCAFEISNLAGYYLISLIPVLIFCSIGILNTRFHNWLNKDIEWMKKL